MEIGKRTGVPYRARPPGQIRPLRARDVQLYRACDDFSGLLVYLMVIFSPWALGTTQPWSTRIMNGAAYLLGGLLALKWVLRRFTAYKPPRWGEEPGNRRQKPGQRTENRRQESPAASRFTAVLAGLTVAILVFCLISAVNAQSTYHPRELSFAYHSYVAWLPHSLDRSRSWLAFWNYLGLACSFWAIRDWLLGRSAGEERAGRMGQTPMLPTRLRRLLWLLAINGPLLGLEGIAQRLEGSGKLLFLVKPHVNPGADTQFGPYAYRANAAQYFNLLWPVCLGFWWILQRSGESGRKAHHLLLLCGAIMAACPIISTSRGGALVALGLLAPAAVFMLTTDFLSPAQGRGHQPSRRLRVPGLVLFLGTAIALGFALGWKSLQPRMASARSDIKYRERMYDAARPMAADYPLFGTGPGTFETVFQLYRFSTGTYWPAQLHNDWLETRITFGVVGSALIALAFVTVLARWFARGGIHSGWQLVMLIWLALAGCLVHARYDFPFQIHSILFLFLLLCAVLSILSHRSLLSSSPP